MCNERAKHKDAVDTVTQKEAGGGEKAVAQCTVATREERILKTLSSKRARVYALFLQYSVTIFEPVNTYLQSEAPLIHKLRRIVLDLCKQILIKFMTAETVIAANDLLAINCEDKSLHRSNSELIIGAATRAAVVKLNKGVQQEPCLHEDLYQFTESF